MMATLKAEWRKLLTVRSTLVIVAVAFLVSVGLIGFWIYGFRNVSHAEFSDDAINSMILSAVTFIGVVFSFLAILLVGHEYRYNTIVYSFTSVNHRSKVFFAKLLVLLGFVLAASFGILFCTVLAFYAGFHASQTNFIAQHIALGDVIRRSLSVILGNVCYAFVITMLLRSLVGAIAVVLVMPTTLESILSFILKDDAKYLPYTALNSLSQFSNGAGFTNGISIVLTYIVVLGGLSYFLFLRRDAN